MPPPAPRPAPAAPTDEETRLRAQLARAVKVVEQMRTAVGPPPGNTTPAALAWWAHWDRELADLRADTGLADVVRGEDVVSLAHGSWVSAWEDGRPASLGAHRVLVVGECGDSLMHVLASQELLRVWWRGPN